MHKNISPLVIVMLLLPIAFCWGQQTDSLFTTPFVDPLAKDSVSVGQVKARMEELKAKIEHYFPGDYSFHVVSYENERIVDRLNHSKTICRGAKKGAIVAGCLFGLFLIKFGGYDASSVKPFLVNSAVVISTGAFVGSAVSAIIYTENISDKEIANINDLIKRYNAIAAKKADKP
jgi:hypothetical protein